MKDLRPDLHVFGACVGSGETEEDNSYDQHPTILQKNTTSVYENGKKQTLDHRYTRTVRIASI